MRALSALPARSASSCAADCSEAAPFPALDPRRADPPRTAIHAHFGAGLPKDGIAAPRRDVLAVTRRIDGSQGKYGDSLYERST
jgi:hypothetical protein